MKAKEIAWYLAVRGSSPFKARQQLAVVPNVSWSMLPWEADLLVLSKAGFLTEVEIKISLSDWKADFYKAKHKPGPHEISQAQMIKHFYYAAPMELAKRYTELDLPLGAGVISVPGEGTGKSISVLKSSVPRADHRKLTDNEQKRLLRLAAIKAWGLFHKPAEPIKECP